MCSFRVRVGETSVGRHDDRGVVAQLVARSLLPQGGVDVHPCLFGESAGESGGGPANQRFGLHTRPGAFGCHREVPAQGELLQADQDGAVLGGDPYALFQGGAVLLGVADASGAAPPRPALADDS